MKGTEMISTLVALITALLLMPPAADGAAPTAVSFQTADSDLQRLFDAAEAKAAANIVQFTPTMKALVEGGGYGNVWIETQPMGGEMYAKRNLEVALNNQLLFLLASAAMAGCPAWSFPPTPPSSAAGTRSRPKVLSGCPNMAWPPTSRCFRAIVSRTRRGGCISGLTRTAITSASSIGRWKPTMPTSGARAIPTATDCWKPGAPGTRAKTTARGCSPRCADALAI